MKPLQGTKSGPQHLLTSDQLVTVSTKLGSTLLFVILIAIVIWKYDSIIRQQLLPRVSGVDIFGLKFDLAEQRLNQLTQQFPIPSAETLENGTLVPLSDEGKRQILVRLKVVEPILQGSRILWVDDNPDWQVRERNFLHVIGIGVDCAQTNKVAYNLMEAQKINQTPYDLVISDVGRDHEGSETGFTLLAGLRARGFATKVIFYSPSSLPTPPEAYAMTHYTDILLNDVFDVLELQRTLRPDVQNAILNSKDTK